MNCDEAYRLVLEHSVGELVEMFDKHQMYRLLCLLYHHKPSISYDLTSKQQMAEIAWNYVLAVEKAKASDQYSDEIKGSLMKVHPDYEDED